MLLVASATGEEGDDSHHKPDYFREAGRGLVSDMTTRPSDRILSFGELLLRLATHCVKRPLR